MGPGAAQRDLWVVEEPLDRTRPGQQARQDGKIVNLAQSRTAYRLVLGPDL